MKNKNSAMLCMSNIASKSESLYFWAKNCNGLFSFNISTGNCNLLMQDLNSDYRDDKLLYSKCMIVEDTIIVAPYYSNNILVYDMNKEKADYIPIEEGQYFCDMVRWRDWIYFFGGNNAIRMNINELNVESIKKEDSLNANLVCSNGKDVYINSNNKDEILCFDMEDQSIVHIGLGSFKINYNTVVFWNDKLVLSGDSEKILLWDLEANDGQIYDIPKAFGNREAAIDTTAFCRSDVMGEYVLFSPAKMNYAMAFNCATKTWISLFQLLEEERSAAFAEVDEKHRFFICEKLKPAYEPTRVLRLKDNFEIEETSSFILPNDVKLKNLGLNETIINSLSRFIHSIV